MKSAMAALVLVVLCPVLASAQGLFHRNRRPAPAPRDAAVVPASTSSSLSGPGGLPTGEKPSTLDTKVYKANEALPAPIPLEEIQPAEIALPNVDPTPYVLTKDAGPFMVMARTFRGPDATRYATALVLELRNQHQLPAYIFNLKIKPGGSNIRNVQPTAPPGVPNGIVAAPEKYRTYDEAAVLVGNEKTIDDAEGLLTKVKHLHVECLENVPTLYAFMKGRGLKGAYITTNPYAAAQNIYPGRDDIPRPGQTFDPSTMLGADPNRQTVLTSHRKADPLVLQMNQGPHSIYRCPGPYTLQVAEFTGRATLDPNDPSFRDSHSLQKSPLMTAHDDAEELAKNLSRTEQLVKAGYRPYVYHDRSASYVTLGSFQSPDDPTADPLRQLVLKMGFEFKQKETGHKTFFEVKQRGQKNVPLVPSSTLMPVPRP